MHDWVKRELRANFVRASRAGRQAARAEPRAACGARDEALHIELTNGVSLTVPVKLIPSLKRAAPSDVSSVEVLGRGCGLHWENLNIDLSVSALVSSVFEAPEGTAELGRVGRRQSSEAKAVAAGKNGRKGARSRPRRR
jgi:hypothetical protein